MKRWLAGLCCVGLAAQDDVVFRSDTTLVRVDVQVLDKDVAGEEAKASASLSGNNQDAREEEGRRGERAGEGRWRISPMIWIEARELEQ